MNNKTFNEKPSERLQFALDTLVEFEAPNSPVTPDMCTYFKRSKKVCFACLGGMAAIKKFNIPYAECEDFMARYKFINANILDAYEDSLDAARTGDLHVMFRYMNLDVTAGKTFDRYMSDYNDTPEAFKLELVELISDLKKGGF